MTTGWSLELKLVAIHMGSRVEGVWGCSWQPYRGMTTGGSLGLKLAAYRGITIGGALELELALAATHRGDEWRDD